jgi:hypothetical protein
MNPEIKDNPTYENPSSSAFALANPNLTANNKINICGHPINPCHPRAKKLLKVKIFPIN